jgi:hypothetical protein
MSIEPRRPPPNAAGEETGLLKGATVGRYVVLGLLGRGGMAAGPLASWRLVDGYTFAAARSLQERPEQVESRAALDRLQKGKIIASLVRGHRRREALQGGLERPGICNSTPEISDELRVSDKPGANAAKVPFDEPPLVFELDFRDRVGRSSNAVYLIH